MSVPKIKNLEDLLQGYFGKIEGILNADVSRLTAPGENFGSVMLKLDLTLKLKNERNEKNVNAVAKLIPENEFFRKIFNIQVTVKNEIALYKTIVPTLQEFQKEQGAKDVIDPVPEFYGARINLDGSDNVDEDAVLVLENLKTQGYVSVDRQTGFNLETTKLILRDMAEFHAVSLALKLKKPDVFEAKIKTYVRTSNPSPPDETAAVTTILNILKEDEKCAAYVSLIEKYLGKSDSPEECREPFATLAHTDMWVNNILVKFEGTKPVKIKFVDFQGYSYLPPTADLFFFLWSSVQLRLVQNNFDDLVKYYHQNFVDTLAQLKCDVTPFSIDKLYDELSYSCKHRLNQVLFMTIFVILTKPGGVISTEKGGSGPPVLPDNESVTPEAKEKVRCFVDFCCQRGWI